MNTDELDEVFRKDVEIDEIIKLAFRKYKLSGKKSMNTFIFTNTKKLSEEDYDKVLEILDKKIKEYKKEQEHKQDEELERELMKTLKIQGIRNQRTRSAGNGEGSLYYSNTKSRWIFKYYDTNGKRQSINQRRNETEEDFKIRIAEIKESWNN